MNLLIGTSGWYYNEWVGPFYNIKKGMFTHYKKVFNTTEVNSTFYRYPTTRMVRGWYKTAPPGFMFALKLPKLITHEKWLGHKEEVKEDTERFLDIVKLLAEKLGPILIQLRPKFNFEDHAESLERYLEFLPKNYEWAIEFRHLSWMNPETYKILQRHGIAYTIVDEPLLPPEIHVTTDFAYIRWHGHGVTTWYDYDYSREELEKWIPKVKETSKKTSKIYGFFNNHFGANAVKNAVEILDMMGSMTSIQKSSLEKILIFKSKESKKSSFKTLETFSTKIDDLSISDYLMRFTTTSRLVRAEKITDDELKMIKNIEGDINATIRNYVIKIDEKNKVMKHNCDDWRKGIRQKRMCKHLIKFFLSLPNKQAKRILTDMWNNKENWRFESKDFE